MEKFVDEWNILQTLGEGAYGEVKLLVHQISGDAVAMKMIDLNKWKDARDSVDKEIKIHRLLDHENVIKFLGTRVEPNYHYIFLQFAAGGELFNRIEPDFGMPTVDARKYFRELLSGVEYLHSKGIAHRDLKPENLLLDAQDRVKISDFGMATVFRLREKERLLDRKCGTLPYVAPEVLIAKYRAAPADLWSCGVVLVAMLAGELPWDEPRPNQPEYASWCQSSCITSAPWNKLDNLAFGLIRKLLAPVPAKRPNVRQLLNHPWTVSSDELDSSRACAHVVQSQMTNVQKVTANIDALFDSRRLGWSQPTNDETLVVTSQCTQQGPLTQHDHFRRLTKGMTRLQMRNAETALEAIKIITQTLDALKLQWRRQANDLCINVSTVDRRKMALQFRAYVLDFSEAIYVDFRLCKGCGLEFKKLYSTIKKILV